MTHYLTHRRALAIVGALLLLCSWAPASVGTSVAYLPRSVITWLHSPFTGPLRAVSAWVRPGDVHALELGEEDLRVQNERLAVQNKQLAAQVAELQRQVGLLSQARSIAMRGVTFLDAAVTARSRGRLGATVTLDRGRNRGIYPGAPVILGANLVGRVTEAYPATADVELVTAAESLLVEIGPIDPATGRPGVTEMITLADDGRRFQVAVARSQPVREGDVATLRDPTWPTEAQGYFVGVVTDVSEDRKNPLNDNLITIEPMRSLGSLTRVTVVVPAGQRD